MTLRFNLPFDQGKPQPKVKDSQSLSLLTQSKKLNEHHNAARNLIIHPEARGFAGAERVLQYFLEGIVEAGLEVTVAVAVAAAAEAGRVDPAGARPAGLASIGGRAPGGAFGGGSFRSGSPSACGSPSLDSGFCCGSPSVVVSPPGGSATGGSIPRRR